MSYQDPTGQVQVYHKNGSSPTGSLLHQPAG